MVRQKRANISTTFQQVCCDTWVCMGVCVCLACQPAAGTQITEERTTLTENRDVINPTGTPPSLPSSSPQPPQPTNTRSLTHKTSLFYRFAPLCFQIPHLFPLPCRLSFFLFFLTFPLIPHPSSIYIMFFSLSSPTLAF